MTTGATGREPLAVLREVFGYQTYRLLQREIIEHVMGGGDAFVLMPTGGGKSVKHVGGSLSACTAIVDSSTNDSNYVEALY